MKKIVQYIIFLLIPLPTFSAEFSSLSLSGWNKEELSRDHLRFTHSQQKNLTIHLQVDNYNPESTWEHKTLAADIAELSKKRRFMSAFLGITNYKIQSYKYQKNASLNVLELAGSYSRLGHQLIYFKEMNFYYRDHFLQLKIISEDDLSTFNLERIIREINPEQVDID